MVLAGPSRLPRTSNPVGHLLGILWFPLPCNRLCLVILPMSTYRLVFTDAILTYCVNSGCSGGWPYNAYQYVMGAGGMEPYSKYPYTAQNGACEFQSASVVAKISNWEYVTQNQDEDQMVCSKPMICGSQYWINPD